MHALFHLQNQLICGCGVEFQRAAAERAVDMKGGGWIPLRIVHVVCVLFKVFFIGANPGRSHRQGNLRFLLRDQCLSTLAFYWRQQTASLVSGEESNPRESLTQHWHLLLGLWNILQLISGFFRGTGRKKFQTWGAFCVYPGCLHKTPIPHS